MWADELFSGARPVGPPGDYREAFWSEVHRSLRYRHGKVGLSSGPAMTVAEDAFRFLMVCQGEEFLDFLEYIFGAESFFHVSVPDRQIIDELNDLL